MVGALNEFASHFRRWGADDNALAVVLKPAAALQAMLASTDKQTAPTAPAITTTSPEATNASDANALLVNRWWQPVFSQSATQELTGHCVVQTLAREGYVWTHVRGLYVFKHDSELGNASAHSLFDRLKVQAKEEGAVARSFDAYSVSFDDKPVAVGESIAAGPGVALMRRA